LKQIPIGIQFLNVPLKQFVRAPTLSPVGSLERASTAEGMKSPLSRPALSRADQLYPPLALLARGGSLDLEAVPRWRNCFYPLMLGSAYLTWRRQIPGGAASPISSSAAACSPRWQSWKLQTRHGLLVAWCIRASARELLGNVSARLQFIDLPPPPQQNADTRQR
jgi:hypothetical protein